MFCTNECKFHTTITSLIVVHDVYSEHYSAMSSVWQLFHLFLLEQHDEPMNWPIITAKERMCVWYETLLTRITKKRERTDLFASIHKPEERHGHDDAERERFPSSRKTDARAACIVILQYCSSMYRKFGWWDVQTVESHRKYSTYCTVYSR